jgi:hypothetical protein
VRFTRSQQLGILILCVVIISLQIVLFSDGLFQKTSLSLKDNNTRGWLALQEQVNQLKKKTNSKKGYDLSVQSQFYFRL